MDQKKIGEFIAKLRKEKNMTQQELANKLGVTDRAISKWENARGMPDFALIKPLCDILGITYNEFISGERIDKKDYNEKLEEKIVYVVVENNSLKKFIKNLVKYLIIWILILIIGFAAYGFLHNNWKKYVKYDERGMYCNITNNILTYHKIGNGLLTESYERVINNTLYIMTRNYYLVLDRDGDKLDYGNYNIEISNTTSSYGFREKYLGENISYDNVIVLYSDIPISKLKKLNNNKLKKKINNMTKMCSLKD